MRSNRLATLVRLGLVASLVLAMQVPAASASGLHGASAPILVADELGSPSAVTTPTLTLAASGASAAAATQLTGRLTDEAGQGIPDAEILLESGTDGVSWEPTGTVFTDVTGAFTASRPLIRTIRFRAGWVGRAGESTAVSSTATALFTPIVTPVTKLPERVAPGTFTMKWSAAVPQHTDANCTATLHFVRKADDNSTLGTKDVVVKGVFNVTTGCTEFSARVTLPHSGRWNAGFVLGADSAHERVETTGEDFLYSQVRFTISASKSTVTARGAVRISGSIQNAVSHKGISGLRVRLQAPGGNGWTTVAHATSRSGGKVSFVVHPRSHTNYRFAYDGGTKWMRNGSASKRITTVFTLKGSRSGHFSSKKVWLTEGTCPASLNSGFPTFWLHAQNEKHSYFLRGGNIQFDESFEVPATGWYHFKVKWPVSKGSFTLKIWN